ncbi:MAG: diguanylate cyclase domain-containing protein [Spirochaetota bacterium]
MLLLVFSYVVPDFGVRLEVLLVAVALGTGRTSWRLIRQGRAAEAGLRTALITFAAFYTLLAASMLAIAVLALFVGPIQDFVGRHGGEEFIIVVPELERRDVASMAQRIHSSVRSSRMAGA